MLDYEFTSYPKFFTPAHLETPHLQNYTLSLQNYLIHPATTSLPAPINPSGWRRCPKQ